jgi:hypothetical protein
MLEFISRRSAYFEGSIAWPVVAAFLCLLYSLFFTYFWSYFLSGDFNLLTVGLSLDLYLTALFFGVFFPVLVYQLVFAAINRNRSMTMRNRLLLTLFLPFAVISFILMAFSPFAGPLRG